MDRDNRDYIIQETAAVQAQLSIVHHILENIGLRLECIEDWAFDAEQKKSDWHYDTACKCERCSAMRNMWAGRFDDADDYRMD
jgi:hypothetical protein